MSELVELKSSIDGLGKAFEAFKSTHAAELDAVRKGNGTAELKGKLEKIEADLLKYDESKARIEKALLAVSNLETKGAVANKTAEYKAVVADYIRKGSESDRVKADSMRAEIKAMSSLSGPEGGFWLREPEVDPTVRADVVETSPMLDLVNVQTISGPSLKGKRRTGRATTGGWVGEQSTRIETNTPTVGEWEIFARECYAEPHAPQSFLDDAAVDIEAWLNGQVAFEYDVLINTALFSGDGVMKPRGFMSYPVTDPGNGAFIESTAITTSNSLAADDLINVQESLKEAYQRNARWTFRRATLSKIRKLVVNSTTANYVWQPGLSQGAPSVILGKPYTFMADQAVIAAENGSYPISYGDFREAYTVVRRAGISVIRDAITTKGFVKFYSVQRIGGDMVNFEALKHLGNKS